MGLPHKQNTTSPLHLIPHPFLSHKHRALALTILAFLIV